MVEKHLIVQDILPKINTKNFHCVYYNSMQNKNIVLYLGEQSSNRTRVRRNKSFIHVQMFGT